MFLHIHKQLIDQVDLMPLLQEFMTENDTRIKLFWKEFCTAAQSHLLLLGRVHIFRHQKFRYIFFTPSAPLTPI